MKDQLFLMKPGFVNAGLGPFYCGDSVSVEGMLSFFPALRDALDITYVAFARPRTAIVALIGADHQSVPVLVLGDDAPATEVVTRQVAGRRFIDDEKRIRHYLAMRHGLPTAG